MKKTSISFGLVNIPIEMNPLIKNNDIAFNQLHKKCLTRIKYLKYCPHCKKEVKQSEIIKGYEYEKDKFVTLTLEELANLKSEDEKTIDIVGFIDLNEIDPIYYEKSYILYSNTKSKAFSLFKKALEETKKCALAKTVIGTKFYYVVVRLSNNNLIMNTLYFDEEVISQKSEFESSFTKQELELATRLIKSLKTTFKPEELVDEYHKKLDKAITNKINGKSIKKQSKKKEKNIKDLMTALEMSLKNV